MEHKREPLVRSCGIGACLCADVDRERGLVILYKTSDPAKEFEVTLEEYEAFIRQVRESSAG